jgi:protocatechuate 3,4-dioxygenase beta subunit
MKSRGLLAALVLALALVAGLVWWIGRDPSSAPGTAQASTASEPSPDVAAPVQVEAPISKAPVSESAAPRQREARGKTAYQPAQGPTGSVLVRAVWESSGKPAVNVGVRIERLGGHLLLLADTERTDANGVALFEKVDIGAHFVRGDRSGMLMGEVVATQRAELELRLEPGLTVAGSVTDSDGRSVSQGLVWHLDADRWIELAECDASGRYRIEELPPNSKLAATARDRSPSKIVKVSGEVGDSVQVDLQVGGQAASVLGQILDPDERPVTRAAVVLIYQEPGFSLFPAEPRRSATCDDEGRFALHSVPLGAAKLIVQTEHFAPQVLELDVRVGERHELIVHLTPGAELTGVISRESKPAAGAQVLVGNPLSHFWGGAVADNHGRYRITGLPSGTQSVGAFLRLDGDRRLQWVENDDEDVAGAKGRVELVAGRAVIWNAELEKKRD